MRKSLVIILWFCVGIFFSSCEKRRSEPAPIISSGPKYLYSVESVKIIGMEPVTQKSKANFFDVYIYCRVDNPDWDQTVYGGPYYVIVERVEPDTKEIRKVYLSLPGKKVIIPDSSKKDNHFGGGIQEINEKKYLEVLMFEGIHVSIAQEVLFKLKEGESISHIQRYDDINAFLDYIQALEIYESPNKEK